MAPQFIDPGSLVTVPQELLSIITVPGVSVQDSTEAPTQLLPQEGVGFVQLLVLVPSLHSLHSLHPPSMTGVQLPPPPSKLCVMPTVLLPALGSVKFMVPV